jgi:hypothetical protein
MISSLGNLANSLSSVIEEVVDQRILDNGKRIDNSESVSDILNSLHQINIEIEIQKSNIEELIEQNQLLTQENIFLSKEINNIWEKINRPSVFQKVFSYFGII